MSHETRDGDGGLKRSIERWKQTAADEVDSIGGWRDATAERAGHSGDPSRYWSDAPNQFYSDSTYLTGIIVARFPQLDPKPIQEVYSAVSAWYADLDASRVPPQANLFSSLERAMMTLQSIEVAMQSKQTDAPRLKDRTLGECLSFLASPAIQKILQTEPIGEHGRRRRIQLLTEAAQPLARLRHYRMKVEAGIDGLFRAYEGETNPKLAAIPLELCDATEAHLKEIDQLIAAVGDAIKLAVASDSAMELFAAIDATTPQGWEGPSPDRSLREVADVTAYVQDKLLCLNAQADMNDHRGSFYCEQANEAIRNSYRALHRLKIIPSSPQPAVADDPIEAERLLGNLLAELRRLESAKSGTDDTTMDGTRAKPRDEEPKDYLFGWPAILDALRRKNNAEEKSRIRRLNDSPLHPGPIVIPGQGGQPKVEKSELIKWWNDLANRFDEIDGREQSKAESVSDQYKHGRDGIVAPNIGGSVKKRRKRGG